MHLFGNREWINKNKYSARKAQLEELYKDVDKTYVFMLTHPDGKQQEVTFLDHGEQAALKKCRKEYPIARADLLNIIYPEVCDTNTGDLFACNPGQNTSQV